MRLRCGTHLQGEGRVEWWLGQERLEREGTLRGSREGGESAKGASYNSKEEAGTAARAGRETVFRDSFWDDRGRGRGCLWEGQQCPLLSKSSYNLPEGSLWKRWGGRQEGKSPDAGPEAEPPTHLRTASPLPEGLG